MCKYPQTRQVKHVSLTRVFYSWDKLASSTWKITYNCVDICPMQIYSYYLTQKWYLALKSRIKLKSIFN